MTAVNNRLSPDDDGLSKEDIRADDRWCCDDGGDNVEVEAISSSSEVLIPYARETAWKDAWMIDRAVFRAASGW